MEALDKVIRLTKKTARPKISITYGDIDERELKIVNRLAAMTVDERLRFNNYQCDIIQLICVVLKRHIMTSKVIEI